MIAFLVAAALTPVVIHIVRKAKARQTILHYVDNHLSKQGTPTMGGIAFLIAIIAACLIMGRSNKLSLYTAIAVTLAYGIIGFLDDFIKIFFKRNLGLKAYQKIITQTIVSLIVAFFVYRNNYFLGSTILIPFTKIEFDLKFWIVPFVIFIFLAMTNSVNLTDGLDGLAGGVGMVYMLAIAVIQAIMVSYFNAEGYGAQILNEYTNMALFSAATAGGVFGYLIFNSYPAKIFMGDTGSLALGAAIACSTVFTRLELLAPILGIMFVLSAVSVIMQVAYFKLTKGKRIFLMSPLHHHFERKGYHEAKISFIYITVTTIAGFLCIALYLAFI